MRGSEHHTRYEYQDLQNRSNRVSKSLQTYREKYLELRKMMRKYSKESGLVFPDTINRAIGLKNK